MLTFHKDMKVMTIFGGTNKSMDIKLFKNGVNLLIATPGRFIDHIQNTPGFSDKFTNLKFLIFDEADQLLDMGFMNDIKRIISFLPPKDTRQTLLFSATVSPNIEILSKTFLRSSQRFIDTVGREAPQTHEHVTQEFVLSKLHDLIPTLFSILNREMSTATGDYKIIVFFTTARLTGFMAKLFQDLIGNNVLEIHSRKSQNVRNITTSQFKVGKKLILFSSDVSARGMDYPDVSCIVQVGVTSKDQYIHRLGRTARSGKDGKGISLILPFEEMYMRNELKSFNLKELDHESLNMTAFIKPCNEKIGNYLNMVLIYFVVYIKYINIFIIFFFIYFFF